MRKERPSIVCLASLLLGVLLPAQVLAAEPKPEAKRGLLELGLYGGIFLPSSVHELYDPDVAEHKQLSELVPDFGLRAGYYFLSFLGAEIEGGLMPAGVEPDLSALVWTARGHLLGQLPGRFTPFLLAGGGVLGVASKNSALGGDKDAAFHWGLGAKYFFTPALLGRIDGRHLITTATDQPVDEKITSHFEILLGLSYALDLLGPGEPLDTDKDGLVDERDRCPQDPEDKDGFEDGDGCPEPDNDQDGILDADDKCRDEAEDKDDFEDSDGCPDPDNDQDGVLDASDKCPSQAGPRENGGCPDGDRDGDGIVDRLDKCPDEPGDQKNQGCKPQLVVVTAKAIEILDKIHFRPGSAKILEDSFPLLNKVAEVLKEHPNITKISIEGHTDGDGSEAMNLRLSKGRAKSVLTYLVGQGIEASRLTSTGFGESKPIETNNTAEGKAANRRVEFIILEQTGAPPVE